jgi:hypothetical protein
MPAINYTTHDGLPQIQVQKLFQDSRGYIWVGTKGGLARFNGESFDNYLTNQYITRIAESGSGSVFISTKSGVYKYDRNEMRQIVTAETPTTVLPGKDEYYILDDSGVHLYVNNLKVKTFPIHIAVSSFVQYSYYDKTRDIAFFYAQKDQMIYYIRNAELFKIDLKNLFGLGIFENGTVYTTQIEGIKAKVIDPITQEVFFTYNIDKQGVYSINEFNIPCAKHVFQYQYQVFELDSLSESVRSLDFPIIKVPYKVLLDKDENFWVATDNGVYQVSSAPFEVFSRDYMNDMWTIVKGKDGKLYGGALQNGLYQFDLESNKKIFLKAPRNQYTSYETEYYYGASKDALGNLYFPTQFGLVKYNYKKAVKLDNSLSLITKYDYISNKIIAGQGNGLAFFNENGKKETYRDSTKKFISSHPTDFEFQGDSMIWISSWNGLATFDRSSRKFSLVKTKDSLYPPGVVAMDKDKYGNIWLGGTDGLWFFDNKFQVFQKIKPDIYKKYILDIQVIDEKYLLIGTSHEVYIVDMVEYQKTGFWIFKMYNFRNGFVGEEIAQNGFHRDNNLIYIPTTTYTAILDLDKINFTPDYFDVFITNINEAGLSYAESAGEQTVFLQKGDNKLDILFETVGFGLPTRSMFQYKMEPIDDKWSTWKDHNHAAYSNLKSGTYTFKVRAINGSQPGTPILKENKVHIKISLPFYQEPGFYKIAFFLLLLLSLLAFYLYYNWYKNRLKVEENERKLKFQEIATLQAQMNPHFIFNFLSSVQNIISKNQPEKANEYLIKFSRLMRNYMESSIKSTQILKGNIAGNEISVKEETDMLRIYLDLEKMKYPEGIVNYSITLADEALYHRTLPPLILQPFVENALKHGILPKGTSGNITIAFSEVEECLICKISDNGIGRKESMERKKDSIPANKSRGLELIKKRVEVLNQLGYHIEIAFDDPIEGGTKVIIKIQH